MSHAPAECADPEFCNEVECVDERYEAIRNG